MRLPTFLSEFEDYERVVTSPKEPAELDKEYEKVDASERIESAQQNLLINAVRDFYLAKRFYEFTLRAAEKVDPDTVEALNHASQMQMRSAIMSIAGANDQLRRTRSLHNVLLELENAVKAIAETDAQAASVALSTLRKWTNRDTVKPLEYVHHLRNKWAGHASHDRSLDNWANADTFVRIDLVEEALVTLVNAHALLAQLLESNPVLATLVKQDETPGEDSIRMSIDWGAVEVFAPLLRDAEGKYVAALERLLMLGVKH